MKENNGSASSADMSMTEKPRLKNFPMTGCAQFAALTKVSLNCADKNFPFRILHGRDFFMKKSAHAGNG